MSRARRGSVLTSWRQDPACVPASATLSPPSLHPLLALPRPLPHSEKLAGIRLEVEDVALTAASQRRKLEVVLEAANRSLQVEQPQVKWSVDSTWGLGPGRRPGQGWRSLGPSAAGAVAQPPRVWAQPQRWDRGQVGTRPSSPRHFCSPRLSLRQNRERGLTTDTVLSATATVH